MNPTVSGTRPRPRVGFIGNFDEKDLEYYNRLFPTIWVGSNIDHLKHQVHQTELDLLVIGEGIVDHSRLAYGVHVICFSDDVNPLPGPLNNSSVEIEDEALTEEYLLPDLPLPFNRRREADLSGVDSIRGWVTLGISVNVPYFSASERQKHYKAATNRLAEDAIVIQRQKHYPLAAIYWRESANLGVALLPNPVFDQARWIEVITTHWAQIDPESFPTFGDWTKLPDWMVSEELEILESINQVEKRRQQALEGFSQEIDSFQAKLTETIRRVNQGHRQLLTSQSDELVDAVAAVFGELGFAVESVDQSLESGQPKREDLRLKDPNAEQDDWEAIVEVRGYKRSAGKTNDLIRISRFAELYLLDKGRSPDKRIYVVNGQIELSPPQRLEPLASVLEDLAIFAENDGLVISTLDLFRVVKVISESTVETIRNSIKSTEGRWILPSLSGVSSD